MCYQLYKKNLSSFLGLIPLYYRMTAFYTNAGRDVSCIMVLHGIYEVVLHGIYATIFKRKVRQHTFNQSLFSEYCVVA